MNKTHEKSRFELKSLEQIRDCNDIVLQFQKTGSVFTETKKDVYICEVVGAYDFKHTPTLESLSAELIKASEENRRLRRRIDDMKKKYEKLLKQIGAGANDR